MTMNLQETFKFNSNFSCTFQQILTQYKHQQQFIYMSRVGKNVFEKYLPQSVDANADMPKVSASARSGLLGELFSV